MIYVVGGEVSSKIATNDVENFEIDDGAAGSSKWHLSMDLPAERLYHGAGVVNQEVRKATHRCLSVSLGLLSLLLAPRRRLLSAAPPTPPRAYSCTSSAGAATRTRAATAMICAPSCATTR